MTHNDYEILATALAQTYLETKTVGERKGVYMALEHITQALQVDNPRFLPGKFCTYVMKMYNLGET